MCASGKEMRPGAEAGVGPGSGAGAGAGGRSGLRIVVMGVCGSGKSTFGRALAARLGACGASWAFRDGDDWHSALSRTKMRTGVPLQDADREGWLEALGGVLCGWEDGGLVLACSALKRRYRDALRNHSHPAHLQFVCLEPPEQDLRRRLQARQHDFMPAGLLDSQLEALEPPSDAGSDAAILVRGSEACKPPSHIAEAVAQALGPEYLF